MKKHSHWFFHNRICCQSVFSSKVPYVPVNNKVHFPKDIISWQPAKTVWQNMQMRALGVVLKTERGFYGRCMADIWESRLFFQCFFFSFSHHATDFLPDFSSVLLYGCQNCKVHCAQDIISWQPAKTVWQNMQMRASTVGWNVGMFRYSSRYSMSNFVHMQPLV